MSAFAQAQKSSSLTRESIHRVASALEADYSPENFFSSQLMRSESNITVRPSSPIVKAKSEYPSDIELSDEEEDDATFKLKCLEIEEQHDLWYNGDESTGWNDGPRESSRVGIKNDEHYAHLEAKTETGGRCTMTGVAKTDSASRSATMTHPFIFTYSGREPEIALQPATSMGSTPALDVLSPIVDTSSTEQHIGVLDLKRLMEQMSSTLSVEVDTKKFCTGLHIHQRVDTSTTTGVRGRSDHTAVCTHAHLREVARQFGVILASLAPSGSASTTATAAFEAGFKSVGNYREERAYVTGTIIQLKDSAFKCSQAITKKYVEDGLKAYQADEEPVFLSAESDDGRFLSV